MCTQANVNGIDGSYNRVLDKKQLLQNKLLPENFSDFKERIFIVQNFAHEEMYFYFKRCRFIRKIVPWYSLKTKENLSFEFLRSFSKLSIIVCSSLLSNNSVCLKCSVWQLYHVKNNNKH